MHHSLHNSLFPKISIPAVCFILFMLLPAAARQAPHDSPACGPLYTKNIYPPYLPFIDLAAESAQCLPAGSLAVKTMQNYANTFRLDYGYETEDRVVLIDTESYAFTLDLAYSLFPFLETGVECSLVTLGSGWLDPAIVFFHNTFGFPNSGRTLYPYYGCDVIIGSQESLWWSLNGPGWGLRDATIRLKMALFNGWDDCLFISLQPALKIPLPGANPLFAGTQPDAAIRLLFDLYFTGFALYLDAGWAWLATPLLIPDSLFYNQLFFSSCCLEWAPAAEGALLALLEFNTSPYCIGQRFLDSPVITISLGGRMRLFPCLHLQVSFTEEFLFFAATDIAGTVSLVLVL